MEYLTKDTLGKKFSGHCLDITIQNYPDMFKLNSYQLTLSDYLLNDLLKDYFHESGTDFLQLTISE